jgi:hypothetical protein
VRPAALACLLCALSVCAGEADAAEPGRLSFEAGAEGFSWREYDQGRRLLAETGPRLRLSAAYGNVLTATSGLLFDLSITGQAGEVDYDGQDNSGRFVASHTRYHGYGVEAQVGYRHDLSAAGLALDVFGGLNLTGWRRDIRSGVNSLGQAVAGFVEDYTILSGRLGIGLLHSAGSIPARLVVGATLPVDIDEDLAVRGRSITLHPGRRTSAFASWQLSLAPAVDGSPFGTYLRLYWESRRLDPSPARAVDDLSVWQPESHMDVFGLVLGMKY